MNWYFSILKRKLKSNKKFVMIFVIVLLFFLKHLLSDFWLKLELLGEYIDIEIRGEQSFDSNVNRYIMYRCDQVKDSHDCGGLGDRLKGILSAYLWALLDNRKLIIKVNRPCNLVNLLRPNEVNWDQDVNVGWWQTSEMDKRGNDAFKERLGRMKFTRLAQSKQLLILHTNRNYAETIGKNLHYAKKLRELGFDPSNLDLPYTFLTLYDRLFKLSPDLENKYAKFILRAKPTPNTKLICAQVRIGGTKHARKKYLDILSQPVSNSKRFRQLIRDEFIKNLTKNEYRVFLTTDNHDVYDDFLADFGPEVLVHNEGPFNHIDYIPYSTDVNDCTTSEKAILDFHCLAKCDAAVISRSQFGRMGLWRRKEPAKDVYAYNTDLKKFVKIEHIGQFRVT